MTAIIRYFIIAVALVSVWRVSNGDLTWIANTAITIFNTAVDTLTTFLSSIFGTGAPAPKGTPLPTPTGTGGPRT